MTDTETRRWRYLRPFPNAHWTLPVALLAFWDLLVPSLQCSSDHAPLELAAFPAMIVMALWLADLRSGPVAGWRRAVIVIQRAGGDLLTFFALFLLAAIPMFILTPAYECYSERARISGLFSQIESTRNEIASRIEYAASVRDSGVGLKIRFDSPTNVGLVSRDAPSSSQAKTRRG